MPKNAGTVKRVYDSKMEAFKKIGSNGSIISRVCISFAKLVPSVRLKVVDSLKLNSSTDVIKTLCSFVDTHYRIAIVTFVTSQLSEEIANIRHITGPYNHYQVKEVFPSTIPGNHLKTTASIAVKIVYAKTITSAAHRTFRYKSLRRRSLSERCGKRFIKSVNHRHRSSDRTTILDEMFFY